jgi:hypothetical protein
LLRKGGVDVIVVAVAVVGVGVAASGGDSSGGGVRRSSSCRRYWTLSGLMWYPCYPLRRD